MGIHAVVNLSHLAHQVTEPFEQGRFDYDEYVISEAGKHVAKFSGSRDMWQAARSRFLHLFNVEKRQVILIGRVFN